MQNYHWWHRLLNMTLGQRILFTLRFGYLRARLQGLRTRIGAQSCCIGAIGFLLAWIRQDHKPQDVWSFLDWIFGEIEPFLAFLGLTGIAIVWLLLKLSRASQFSGFERRFVSELSLEGVTLGAAAYSDALDAIVIKKPADANNAAKLEAERTLFSFADCYQKAFDTAEINAAEFSGTTWGTALDKKIIRNNLHRKVNDRCLLLIEDPEAYRLGMVPRWIGFTHIIPLNGEGWTGYLEGTVNDSTFSPNLIAQRGSETFALLLFSIALYHSKLQNWYPDFSKRNTSFLPLLFRAVLFHITELANSQGKDFEVHNGKKYLSVWLVAQSEDASLQRWLQDRLHFQKLNKRSGDHAPMFKGKVMVEAES